MSLGWCCFAWEHESECRQQHALFSFNDGYVSLFLTVVHAVMSHYFSFWTLRPSGIKMGVAFEANFVQNVTCELLVVYFSL